MQQRQLLLAGAAAALLRLPWSVRRTHDPSACWSPTVPGSVPDVANRELGRRLQAELGQTVVVENKPGGGGAVMAAELKRSAPDGHTLGAAYLSILSVSPSSVQAAALPSARRFQPRRHLVSRLLRAGRARQLGVAPTGGCAGRRTRRARAGALRHRGHGHAWTPVRQPVGPRRAGAVQPYPLQGQLRAC